MEFDAAVEEIVHLMNLKPFKNRTLQAFIPGYDAFVVLPTGYGKSIIFGHTSPTF